MRCYSIVVPQQLGSFPSLAPPVDPEKDCPKVFSTNTEYKSKTKRQKEGEQDLVFLSVRKSELDFLASFTKGWDEQNRNPVLNYSVLKRAPRNCAQQR